MNEIKKYTQNDVQKILVGNKSDLEEKREVKLEEGQNLANFYGVPFVETSAKETTNIADCFMKMAKTVIEKMDKGGEGKRDENSGDLGRPKRRPENTRCCNN